MKIEISGDTSFYTHIDIENHHGDVVFKGYLKMEPDWWVLYDTHKDYLGTVVKRWAGRREHVAVLADALKEIARI